MASSKRSTAPEKSFATTSRERTPTSTSSRTKSTSTTISSVVIALGSNLGDRRYNLLRAVDALGDVMRVVRVSSIHETEPVDAPPPRFLNMVVSGYTWTEPEALMEALLRIEARLGRAPRRKMHEPRIIDLDLILHGAHRVRTKLLTLPHPRATERAFVMDPLRVVWASGLPWFLSSER